MEVREILLALQAKTMTPVQAKEAIRSLRRELAPAPARASDRAPDHAAQVRERLAGELTSSLADALYIRRQDVGADIAFSELGLDSILGVEWIRALNARYGLSLPTTKLYDHPTIHALSAYLATELHRTGDPSPEAPAAARLRTGASYGLVLSTVHSLDELSISSWEIPGPANDEVTIQVRASGINFPDTLCVHGLYPTMPEYPFVPGFELAGIVTHTGRDVTSVRVGDEVIATAGMQMGAHASEVNVPALNVIHKPSNLTFEEAAGLPVVFGTVGYAFELAHLAPGEHVLIQTATGGCGLAAMQLAALKGCVCYGTSSRPEKRQLLREIGVEHAIDYKTDFHLEIRRITGGRGVDVVLNMLSGDGIQKGLNCLAPSGRYVELAVHALKASGKLDLSALVHNQSIHSMDLRRLTSPEDRERKVAMRSLLPLLEAGHIVPIVSRIYPISRIKDALQYVARGEHIGKVVISHTLEATVDCTDRCIERLREQMRRCTERGPSRAPTVSMRRTSVPPSVDESHDPVAIAIIGASGQFPKARSLAEFWNNLASGRDCVSEIPVDRWPIDRFYDADRDAPGKTYSKWMGALEEVDRFDPLFFNISPADAEWIDPQQRLFLEHCWRCLEDAGIDPWRLSGTDCGVFVGCSRGDYGVAAGDSGLTSQTMMGMSPSILASRISYFLNLKGPSLAIDTACSSSLVAMAEACDSLTLRRSDLALAGGVCVLSGPAIHIMGSHAGMLSKEGRCFTFDERADGFVPGEGVGVVLLKRLADAVRDRDQIWGVIRGWGLNQDGKTNGITAPSVNAQTALEQEVYRRSGINPETISLVEAHGTGTALGDPIEVEALTASFRSFTDRSGFCAIGSVKCNIGHLLAGAGIASILKVLLALRHRMLPPMIHFKTLNPRVALDGGPFYVNTELRAWESPPGALRRAAVSSFGFSGTNAHVVIEEHRDQRSRFPAAQRLPRAAAVVVLSAKNAERLAAQVTQLVSAIIAHGFTDADLFDIAYTLQVGREPMDARLALTASSIQELVDTLQRAERGEAGIAHLYRGNVKRAHGEPSAFAADGEQEALLDTWIERAQYDGLMDLWVKGLTFDWRRLYGDEPPKRISLPTYPFARGRYWVPTPDVTPCGRAADRPSAVAPGVAAADRAGWPAALDAMIGRLLFAQLASLGLFAGSRQPREERARLAGIAPLYHRWLDESVATLAARGYLTGAGDALDMTAWSAAGRAAAWAEWEARSDEWRGDPSLAAQVDLVDATLRALPEILIGARRATDVLFPAASIARVEALYKNNRVYESFNGVLADALVAYLENRLAADPASRFRILEIGAGTGATSETVLARMAPYAAHIDEYCYSDLSQAFLAHAHEAFGPGHPYLTCRIFNVEQPLGPQAIEAGRYDVAIAANVLHATANIRRTLRTAKATLKPNGLLLLNEIADKSLFAHLTFGLLEGWWRYEDAPLRIPGCPGLAPDVWQQVLQDEGFSGVRFPAADRHHRGLQVIVANSVGATAPVLSVVDPGELRDAVQAALVSALAALMKVGPEDVDVDAEFSQFGFDSLGLTAFSKVLNQTYHLELTPTVFFEHPTLGRLSAHVADVYATLFADRLGLRRTVETPDRPLDPPPVTLTMADGAEPVAVIGMSGRFPQAPDLETFWRNLEDARDSVTEIPRDRWDWHAFDGDPSWEANRTNVRWGAFIEGIDEFDPLFFGISPREAELMDPQQRLLMTYVWKAVEDAGYSARSLAGARTAVFLGTGGHEYSTLLTQAGVTPDGYSVTGMLPSVGPNRISYFLNLHGPSEPVETSCSSALVAIHRALLAISSDQCETALVGAVNLIMTPAGHVGLSKAGMLSEEGRCRTFSAAASGYVRGEGVGILFLKRLSAAERDRDHIYGVIRGSAENHGGRANSLTAPNPQAQTDVITAAYARAGVDPRTIGYIEAHGTGTALGDPIEINSLKSAFASPGVTTRHGVASHAWCGIGSVKTNIGHLEIAAGVAGVIKVLLQLQHKTLVKSLHSEPQNPYISLDGSPFYVVREARPWTPLHGPHGRALPLRAGISSFGAGGVNAHVVLEEYVPRDDRSALASSPRPVVVVLSAKNDERLSAQVLQLLQCLDRRGFADDDLPDIAWTLQAGRDAMEVRAALLVSSMQELKDKLQRMAKGDDAIDGCYRGHSRDHKDALALFGSEDDMATLTESWIVKRRYDKLLALWVRGFAFDWSRLYGTATPRRLSLPTYPFARERCWIPDADGAARPNVPTPAPPPRAERGEARPDAEPDELLTFKEEWQEQPVRPATRMNGVTTVVCFLSDADRRYAFATAIEACAPGAAVVFIAQGETYQKHSSNHYGVVRGEGGSYASAFADIRVEHRGADALFYLWALEDPRCVRDAAAIADLLRALPAAGLRCPVVLLAGAFDDALDGCYLDSWLGFERSLNLVLPDTRLALVCEDLTADAAEGASKAGAAASPHADIAAWTRRLWTELQGGDVESVRYRGDRRYVRRLRAHPLGHGDSIVRRSGTYVITGGAGTLGLLVAEHLAAAHAATVILTGRSAPGEATARATAALEALGGRGRYIQADVCNRSQMLALVADVHTHEGPIHGVIHLAGVADARSILAKDMERFARVLAPKIDGTVMLDEVLRDEPLDFICYFSSSSAILGDFGSCDYAIANRFQTAYARYRDAGDRTGPNTRRVIAVNWPVWKEGGIGFADEESTRLYLKSSGQRPLQTAEGIAVFERLLAEAGAQRLVLAGHPGRLQRFAAARSSIRIAVDIDARPAPTVGPDLRAEMQGLTLEQRVAWDLKSLVSRVLKIDRDRVDPGQNLADCGFDSIGLADLAKHLTHHYGLSVTPAIFFSHPTLAKLADHLLSAHRQRLETFYATAERAIEGGSAAHASDGAPKAASSSIPSTRPAARSVAAAPDDDEPIAIIGLSGRFPRARSIDELWRILVNGEDAVTEIPPDRFDWRQCYGGTRVVAGKTNSKWLGAIPGVREFDPLFFEISPRDAELMDPRQRLLLQEAWNALEDAGYGQSHVDGRRIGIFVGAEQGDYQMLVGQRRGGAIANHDGVLAARLAYFLNLHGPAMAINTACSSGLVAVHQACQSLRAGDCETAIAAGVNVVLTPNTYVSMSQAGMLSPDGKCFAFDRRGNGMVPGEAVVAVVLKRLSLARDGGDPIRAVIRGTGVNYDGRTNGLTAPSGAAQTDLVKEVYARARVNPRSVGYIVAHGTATQLGDPVEIQALSDAFAADGGDHGWCALTSTKTNFGHAFAASGLLSLVSLVQALRHQTIPASLHCHQENEHVRWESSPFYVNTVNRPWPAEPGRPRLGGVSAFGMSGTNVHAIVESWDPPAADAVSSGAPHVLLALSAKTAAALEDRSRDLLQLLRDHHWDRPSLEAMSHTLLCGRHHFAHRCAIVVSDRDHAVQLAQRLVGTDGAPHVHRGTVAREFAGSIAISRYGEELIAKAPLLRDHALEHRETLSALADLYCQGYAPHWDRLSGDARRARIALPTYPFAREQYWVAPIDHAHAPEAPAGGGHPAAAAHHPLLHRNTSDLIELRFTTILTGEEPFLADHVVKGSRVLPGVAYLEMARAAVERVTADRMPEEASSAAGREVGIRLTNVVWSRPLIVGEELAYVHIGIHPDEAGGLDYEIYTEQAGAIVTHSAGSAVLREALDAPQVDLAALRIQCADSEFTGAQCYQMFDTLGITYGPAHRGLERVAAGTDAQGRRVLLARVALPPGVAASADRYLLHPSILDAALQASCTLVIDATRATFAVRQVLVPFALDALEIAGPCPPAVWVWIRDSPGGTEKVPKIDFDLCDDTGRVCVRLTGLSARALEDHNAGIAPATVLFAPAWEPRPLPESASGDADLAYAAHSVIVCGASADGMQADAALDVAIPGLRWQRLSDDGAGIAHQFTSYAAALCTHLQQILRDAPAGDILVQVVVPIDGERAVLSGLGGLLKSATLEEPRLVTQLIGVERVEASAALTRMLMSNRRAPADRMIRYVNGVRYVASVEALSVSLDDRPASPWKPAGVYLVTGGAGALGLRVAHAIAADVRDANLILTGRSALSPDKARQLEALEQAGARIEYHRVDVSDRQAVDALMQSIAARFARLNGIVHCAGITNDGFLVRKTTDELLAVLAPKVAGVVNLDEASRAFALDVFVLFSSLAGAMGNIGQSDYAAANAFMDAYADYRTTLSEAGQRRGRTVSINWPLWAGDGMHVDPAALARLHERTGLTPLAGDSGIAALYRAIALPHPQILVMAGDRGRTRAALARYVSSSALAGAAARTSDGPAPVAVAPAALEQRAVRHFTKRLASTLKLPVERIDPEAPLDEYGFDSLLVMQLTSELEHDFGSLSKTLFFEYQTLAAITRYFLDTHRARLLSLLGEPEAVPLAPPAPARDVPRRVAARQRRTVPQSSHAAAEGTAASPAIAIIGLSGQYPHARTVGEFWENLKAGRDCITEIPSARWDHAVYFDTDKGKRGKSCSKWGGFLDGVDEFDPLFFNISPREAQFMDPQERLFLQCVYATLEDAGYTRHSVATRAGRTERGAVGVFVGVMYEEYQLYGAQAQLLGRPSALGGSAASIANRVSYVCNFQGPSLAVDTMCSSSLTALHLACESLKQGNCTVAIAGGVNVSVHPNKYLLLAQGQFASSTGRCESFGAGGDGYVPSEGVGAVLLKPLAAAEADGDRIYGVIRGTAINHGGRTNGYSVPNPVAQTAVITEALRAAGIPSRAVSYLEAHGTGTALGDPIEIAALTKAFATSDRQFCAIGSVKSNIGHAESAAGIAGVTKVLLQLQHGQLAPSLHSEPPNPHIDFAQTPFLVQRTLSDWLRPRVTHDGETSEYPRIAGISSFGAGGANAHVVIEEYRAAEPRAAAAAHAPAVIVLSAKRDDRLQELARQLTHAVTSRGLTDADLADVAYTLQIGREAMEHRLAFTASSIAQLQETLRRYLASEPGIDGLQTGEVKPNKETLTMLAGDDDAAALISAWMTKGKYARVLAAWVKGVTVDWTALHRLATPKRISLPTYPFARERYWIAAADLLGAPARAEGLLPVPTPSADLDPPRHAVIADPVRRVERLLIKGWHVCPATRGTRSPDEVIVVATADTIDLASRLSQRFRHACVLNLDACDVQWSDELLQRCAGWIDLVGAGRTGSESMAWIPRLQTWIEHAPGDGVVALCVTRGLERHATQPVNLAGAPRVGLYRMLQSEYGRVKSRHVDFDPSLDEPTMIESIVAELLDEGDESEVCYRGGVRYRALLQEAEHDRPAPAWRGIEARPMSSEQVLFITGGTQGLGYLCAQHFVRHHGVRRLVLTGREVFPPRDEWAAHAGKESSVARKIAAIRILEQEGAEVRASSVSLTDERALREELDWVRQNLGPVGGVIHSAGVTDRETPAFVRKTLEGMRTVLSPKVTGLDTLIRCVAQEPLNFFVLFSSVSAAVPSLAVGQSDYAMANAYMDYVADAHAPELPIVSLQWASWKETGLGEARSRAYRQTGLLSHTNAEGLRLLDRVLASKPAPVTLAAVVNPDRWKPDVLMRRAVRDDIDEGARVVATSMRLTPPAALVAATRTWLRSLVSEQLQIDPARLEIDAPLQDYGVDSIMLVQLLRPVGELIGDTLDPSLLFEHPTIDAFARWLAGAHPHRLSSALQPPESEQVSGAGVRADPAVPAEAVPSSARRSATADVAIVGMSCRFPGAPDLGGFWQLLAQGRSAIHAVPEWRWGRVTGYGAGLLDDVTHFDPRFFNIGRADAAAMDPQALLVLEESLHAWSHAGYTPQDVKGTLTGVFLGARSQHRPDAALLSEAANPIVAVGQNYLAANISRFFDLHGPSLVVDTACSSALVAMNLAIQSLRDGEITAALVGGVSVLDGDHALRLFEQRGILQREPTFHLFDRRARGVVLGEGVGIAIVKTLEQAQQDGDVIYAVIKAVAINNDGRTAGPTAPNLQAQKSVMAAALARSGKRAEEIGYVAVNGSGSEVTDLLELKAIEAVYRSADKSPCQLGSMKPNVGHPLCAEGIASLMHVALMLHHRQMVPFLSAQEPMTHYDLAASPFRFTRSLRAWDATPRVAAINCFADGGTNAHMILEAWEPASPADVRRRPLPPLQLVRVDVRAPEPQRAVVESAAPRAAAPESSASGASFWTRVVEADRPAVGFWTRREPAPGSNGAPSSHTA